MDNRKSEHTTRPLTEEERAFAEEHHNLIYGYIRSHQLDIEEWYDILVIPYLNSVKKYFTYEKLQKYSFSLICYRTLDNARSNYFRDMNREKRCPEGGLFSYDASVDDGYKEHELEFDLVDIYVNVEKQVILKELYKEFYRRCTEYNARIADVRKIELEMLLQGYRMSEILNFLSENDMKVSGKTLFVNRRVFQKIFKEVFGI